MYEGTGKDSKWQFSNRKPNKLSQQEARHRELMRNITEYTYPSSITIFTHKEVRSRVTMITTINNDKQTAESYIYHTYY